MLETAQNDLFHNYFSFLLLFCFYPKHLCHLLAIVLCFVEHTITVDFQWAAVRWSRSLSPWTGDTQLGAHASPPRTCLRYGMRFAPGQTALWFIWEIRWIAPLWAGLHLNAWVRTAVWAPEVVVPGGAASNGRTLLCVCLELIRNKNLWEFPKIIFLSQTTIEQQLKNICWRWGSDLFHQHIRNESWEQCF